MWCKQLEFKQFWTTQVSSRNSSVCKEIECKYFCTLDLIIICIVSRNVWKMMLIWMESLFIQENIITMVINLGWTHQYRTQNNYNWDKDKYRTASRVPSSSRHQTRNTRHSSPPHTAHCTHHTAHCTNQTSHFQLHTAHCTGRTNWLYTQHSVISIQAHFLPPHSQNHTVHSVHTSCYHSHNLQRI